MKAKLLLYALPALVLTNIHLAQAQLTKLTVGYSAIAAGHIPAWVAKEAGIFSQNGLDVQLVYLRAGNTATMAVLSPQTPINQLAGPAVVGASLRGAHTVMIAWGVLITQYWLMTRQELKPAEQLKSGSAAIALFGGLGDFMTRIALKRLGLTAVKDVAFLQIGGNPERLSALETGRVQATMLPQPDNFMAQK